MPQLVQDGFPISCEALGLITSGCAIQAKFKNLIDTNREEQGGICDCLSKNWPSLHSEVFSRNTF